MNSSEQPLFQPKPFPVASDEIHLRLLQTTDIHVNLLPYNYFTDRPDPKVGLLQVGSLINLARAEASNSLLLDTGDFLQGTPLGDLFAENNPEGGPTHPSITAMNLLGYDGGTVGNHEFNYGLDFLTAVAVGAGFPIVLANAATRLGETPDQDETLFPPYVILDRQVRDALGQMRRLKIGLIGFVPPQIAIWDRHHLENRLFMRGITEAARAYIPKMRAEGADLIIALSHSGIGAPQDIPNQENASIPLAAIDGIDVVLCGHQHRRFPDPAFQGVPDVDPTNGTIHGKPAVMAGFWGSDLGMIDLALAQDETNRWHLRRHRSTLRPISAQTIAAPEIPPILQRDHSQTLTHIRRSVAQTKQPLHTYFTFIGFDPASRLVAMAKRDRAAALLGQQDLPILAGASPFRAGGHAGPDNYTMVPAGQISLRNLADLYPFPNALSILKVTGAQVKDWLERAAGKFNQLHHGAQNQMLLDPNFPSYHSGFILGVDFAIDLSQPTRFALDGSLLTPDAHRIHDLRHDGQLIAPTDEFLIATNSFRAGGGGAFAGTGPGIQVPIPTEDLRIILTDWVREKQVIDLPPTRNWRFAPMPGTSALLATSPHAQDFVQDAPVPLEHVGIGPLGFSRFRLNL
jgi:2',3'-cyclic-nucleotide 2'-phosphodiesterase / 3'-nucleotidase